MFVVTDLATLKAILGYVCKNEPVQEDINPSIYITNLTHLVSFTVNFFKWSEKKLLITEIDWFFFLARKSCGG